jgi:hypothetical protein
MINTLKHLHIKTGNWYVGLIVLQSTMNTREFGDGALLGKQMWPTGKRFRRQMGRKSTPRCMTYLHYWRCNDNGFI